MAENHYLIMCIILDFVGFNPLSVPSFPKYLDFSHIQILYVSGYLCGLSIFVSDQLYSFLKRVIRTTHSITISGYYRSNRHTWWTFEFHYGFLSLITAYVLAVLFCGCGVCMMLLSRMTTNTFLGVVKANLESVIMYMHRWKYFHHIHHFALNGSNFHLHFIIQKSMVLR